MTVLCVSFTRYPSGQPEETVLRTMPFPPCVGDSVHVDIDDWPILEVKHVRWVYEYLTQTWTVECSVG